MGFSNKLLGDAMLMVCGPHFSEQEYNHLLRQYNTEKGFSASTLLAGWAR